MQYLLDAEPAAVDRLRERLDALGDSLVVVGTGEGSPPTWNVHVHVDDIGAAVEAGIESGRPHRISVTRLEDRRLGDRRLADRHPEDQRPENRRPEDRRPEDRRPEDRHSADRHSEDRRLEDRHLEDRRHDRRTPLPTGPADPDARGAVVVAAGDGLTALFAAEGVMVVDRNPSTAEMLDAIAATAAGRVVLLPNDANTHAVAVSAAREAASTGVRVSVVPTRSPVQALAALAVRDPHRRFSDDVIAMAEAAGACRYGEVCTAQREALTMAGRCRPGDLLGLVDGEVHIIGDGLEQVCRRLLDRMLGGGGELATLVLGADAPETLEAALREHLSQAWPFVELQCYTGGQPRYHLLVGVE
nr:hypothetical protein [Jidongwangia harbinensis]